MKKSAVILSVEANHTAREFGIYRNVREDKKWQIEGIERLGEDAWLIPLPQGMPFLAMTISVSEHASFKYKILHIDHEPVWIDYGIQKD